MAGPKTETAVLYPFLGVHSFLIGLFPFYIPVFLYNHGFSLSRICAFIAVTALGFVITLYPWERMARQVSLAILILISFCSELLLMTALFIENEMVFLIIAGFLNGVFNCHFWMIQRLLFFSTITPDTSGRKFGNFQIFVLLVLQAGILAGGALLEKAGFLPVYLVSVTLAGAAGVWVVKNRAGTTLDPRILSSPPLSFKQVISFKDRVHSRSIFAVDGLFLYLESYFWMISLFLIVQQNYWKLGLLVVFLALFFGVLFVLIKNRIDRLPAGRIYTGAVCLYSLSWLLRGLLSEHLDHISMLLMLSVITFCTSLFRLVFNKRFYDIAAATSGHAYIFMKSYLSQFFLAAGAVTGMLWLKPGNTVAQLSGIYLAAAVIAFAYFLYHPPEKEVPCR
ncbi:MAG: hypothetical protein LC657_09870 [Desulfobacteraceae bacterium]|nr:hypothetical protein [Desulfobacteraceae bacterium]